MNLVEKNNSLTKTRVLLADDHALFRETTRVLLEQHGIDVIGEAADGAMAVRLVQDLHPDVAILDIGMPILNGIDAAKLIHSNNPDIYIILLSVHEEKVYMVEGLHAGAHGYVLKTQTDSELLQSIEAVSQGAVYLAPGISQRVINSITSKTPESRKELTVRERQVLEMVSQGKTNRDIAVSLNLSHKSIELFRSRIMKKLDIHQTAQLVAYAIRHDVIKS